MTRAGDISSTPASSINVIGKKDAAVTMVWGRLFGIALPFRYSKSVRICDGSWRKNNIKLNTLDRQHQQVKFNS